MLTTMPSMRNQVYRMLFILNIGFIVIALSIRAISFDFSSFGLILLVFVLTTIYLLPSWVAAERKQHNFSSILEV